MQFQDRDGAILSAIHTHDGLLAGRHLKALFWPNATLRAMQKRLSRLIDQNYLARPTPDQRRTQPVPEPVYWLGWRGALWIAGRQGVQVLPPTNTGENQMRGLVRRLHNAGVHWLREPRWHQLTHDLAVVDVHLTVAGSIARQAHLRLEAWHYESEFRADGDPISYEVKGRGGARYSITRRIYPDSYFAIVDRRRAAQGTLARARLLLELDNATHANARFGREKVVPGIAYIRSQAYKARFGDNSGRWLIVTTGATRMRNLMRETEHAAGDGAGVFYFTIMPWLTESDVLLDPIWHQVGSLRPVAIFTV